MAIFRCDKCAYLQEVPAKHIGRTAKCPRCQQEGEIHDAISFIEKIIEKYFMQGEKLRELQEQLQSQKLENNIESEENLLEEIDIYHTDALKSEEQFAPVLKWFEQQQIAVEFDLKSVDTTGFFDEVAIALGDNYDTLKEVIEKIKYVQKKGYVDVKLNICNKSQEQIKQITAFCRDLLDYSFVSKFFYQKEDKIIRLKLQTIPTIVNFFNGDWMEWLIFMRLLEFLREKKLSFSCLRNLSITFSNKDVHELDIFFLINNSIPVCIECKSGQFQQYIHKYLTLRKRMKLHKENFLLCIIGLSQKQCEGLTGMHELTFVNESNFINHLETVLKN
jgi:hypothetical protein